MYWLALALLLLPLGANAAACTDGVDCLCDTLAGDTDVVFCEDFEAANYYEDGLSGSWDDDGGFTGWWANGSAWGDRYGNPSPAQCSLTEAADPTRCNPTGAPNEVCSLTEYNQDDLWGTASNERACMDIQRAGDVDDEVGGLTLSPTEIHDGRQILAVRVGPGRVNDKLGDLGWSCAANGGSADCTDVSWTMAAAHATNIVSAGLWDCNSQPWKYDELAESSGGISGFPQYCGNNAPGSNDDQPFRPFLYWLNSAGSSAGSCTAMESAGVVSTIGEWDCNEYVMAFSPMGAYSQTTDWPHGTWACVQGRISGINTTDMRVQLWLDETPILDIDNIDGTIFELEHINSAIYNTYVNTNQGGGGTPTSETTYRYQDNLVIAEGEPVSCASIGFGAAAVEYRAPWRTSSLLEAIMLRGWRAVLLPAGVGG